MRGLRAPLFFLAPSIVVSGPALLVLLVYKFPPLRVGRTAYSADEPFGKGGSRRRARGAAALSSSVTRP